MMFTLNDFLDEFHLSDLGDFYNVKILWIDVTIVHFIFSFIIMSLHRIKLTFVWLTPLLDYSDCSPETDYAYLQPSFLQWYVAFYLEMYSYEIKNCMSQLSLVHLVNWKKLTFLVGCKMKIKTEMFIFQL